jgi:hypothetical protein
MVEALRNFMAIDQTASEHLLSTSVQLVVLIAEYFHMKEASVTDRRA